MFLSITRAERQRKRRIVLRNAFDFLYGRPDVHLSQFLDFHFQNTCDFHENFVGRMSASQFNVGYECRRAIELFGEFPERKIKLITATAYEWAYAFHGCQLI